MVKAGYKQTEVGEIPEDWDVRAIGSFSSITTGNKNTQDRIVDGAYPFFVRSQTVERINSFSFDGEAVLTAGDGVGTGKIFHYINGKFDYHQRVYNIHSFNKEVDGFYFFKYFQSKFYDRILSMTAKSSVDSVRREMISDMKVAIPPRKEQKAIADALSDVDTLIGSLRKLIAKKRDMKTAVMQQLLTGKRRLPGFGEGKGTKQTELGEIPEDWEIDEIGRNLAITTGDKNTQDKELDGEYPFFVRSQKVERINSYSFDGEGVLTAGDGVGTGKIFHYINGKFDFHQRVYLMHDFSDRIAAKYFFVYFREHFYSRIMSMTAKSSVDSVRREMIARMPIVLPPRPEQEALGKLFFDLEDELTVLEKRLAKTKAIKQGMMQELLKGRTRLV
jgi:type I restriction enzyme S subunit